MAIGVQNQILDTNKPKMPKWCSLEQRKLWTTYHKALSRYRKPTVFATSLLSQPGFDPGSNKPFRKI